MLSWFCRQLKNVNKLIHIYTIQLQQLRVLHKGSFFYDAYLPTLMSGFGFRVLSKSTLWLSFLYSVVIGKRITTQFQLVSVLTRNQTITYNSLSDNTANYATVLQWFDQGEKTVMFISIINILLSIKLDIDNFKFVFFFHFSKMDFNGKNISLISWWPYV